MLIYKITNLINSKVYIGQTIHSINARYPGGFWRRPSNEHIKNSIEKYSKENFNIKIIMKCDSLEALNYWEKYYITLYKSYIRENGYNIYYGGGNFIPTSEIRELRRKITNNYIKNNPKELTRLNEINHNYWNTKESRIKKSKQMKEICNKPEQRLKMALVQGAKSFKVFKKDSKEYVGEWINKSMCAEELNIDSRKVCACLLGSRNSHKGYVFKYT